MPADGQLEILIDIRARLDELSKAQQGMRDTAKEATGLGAAMKTGLGIEVARRGVDLLTRSFAESVGAAFQMAGAIKDQSENLQISAEAYQVLGLQIRDAGGDVSLLTQILSTNNRSLAEAREMGSSAASAYRQLGLDVAKLEGMTAQDRLAEVSRAVEDAGDSTKAFSAASVVLGSRNLPTTLGALRSLATDGYERVAATAKKAGLVMEQDTIDTLDRAQKQIEKFKQALAISTGNAISSALSADPALIQDVSNTLLGGVSMFFGAGRAFGSTLGNITNLAAGRDISSYDEVAKEEARRQAEIDRIKAAADAKRRATNAKAAAEEMARQNAIADAQLRLEELSNRRGVIESNQYLDTPTKEKELLDVLKEQIKARTTLIDLIRTNPDSKDTKQQRASKIDRLQSDQTVDIREYYATKPTAFSDRKNQLAEMNLPQNSLQGFGEGAQGGAMDYAMQLGSTGDQVAAAMQSSIGATVSSITEGIYGWITGTQSFGEVLRNLGATVLQTLLQTIIQMGVQWLITAALGRTAILSIAVTGAATRKAETADVIASETAKKPAIMSNAAGSSISSWGLAAAIGLAALIAVLAAFGGFSSGGYTGDGSTSEVAGLVHRKEVVFSAADTAAWGGAGAVEALRLGGPSAVRPSAATATAMSGAGGIAALGGGSGSASNIHLYMDKAAYFDAIRADVSGVAMEVYEKLARS
ncbi:hypothetical protein [Opitutus sp. ER46]|uniref:hypothetical protein n=1 Tax=Opitutus sp. ER46 TaxID=2161864 RepID=UPI000D2F778D|nr:hypothetical protein [Opitutus sp. ER46]PTX95774.1 hypothetical protein DB354_10205 [Opitutus sp. ER46]